MTDPTDRFFEGLSRHEPMLEWVTGRARFDVTDGGETEHWLVEITRGDIQASRRSGAADCVIGGSRSLFNDITSGRVNAMAELLRGGLALEGDPELLVMVQRLFPGPPRSDRQAAVAKGGRSS